MNDTIHSKMADVLLFAVGFKPGDRRITSYNVCYTKLLRFTVGRTEPGRSVFLKVLDAAGIPYEERKEYLLAGGKEKGFEIRATGTFLTSRNWLEGRKIREAVLVRGKAHYATRELMRELGVEIVGR